MRRRFWLAFVVLSAAAASASAEIRRLPTDVMPRYQEVFLKLDPAQPTFEGSVRIDLEVKAAVSTFKLHAPTVRIQNILLKDDAGLVMATADSADDQEAVTFTTARPLRPGPAILGITFTNTFDTHAVGLYHARAGNDWYAMTQMEPDDCRLAFPCFDEPGYKFPWQFTLEIPDTLSAVTNAPEERTEATTTGWKKVIFRKTPPMSSYLVAICVGPWEYVPVPGVSIPTRVVTARGQSKHVSLAVELTPPIAAALEAWFGSPIPYDKLDLIAAPEFWPGAMENPGAILFADRHLIQDAATSGPAARRNLTSLIAHEIAHLWFGDYVTMAWWDDLWLNESFAVWLGDRITDDLYPEFESPITELVGTQRFLAADARGVAPAIRQPVANTHDLLGNVGLVYNKGKRVLSMFEGWVGPDAFQAGVRKYLTDHAWGNAEARDLWNALSSAGGVDVAAALPTFLDQPGCPLIAVRPAPGGKLLLSQRPLSSAPGPAPERAWSVPVGLSVGFGDSVAALTALVGGPEVEYAHGAARTAAWVYPNRGGRGYYRWIVAPPALVTLADSAAAWLEPIERAEISGNLTGLLEAGLVNSGVWLQLEGALAGDPEPMVVAAVADNTGGYLNLLVEDADREAQATWVRSKFRPALDRIGLEARPDESPAVTFLRPRLVSLLGRQAKDPEVIRFCRRQLEAWLADPATGDPTLRGEAFRVAAREGDAALWEKVRAAFETTKRPADRRLLLGTLGAFADPKLARRSLDMLFEPYVRPTEFFTVIGEVANDEPGRDLAFAWLQAEYPRVSGKIATIALPGLCRVFTGTSPTRQAAVTAFFSDPARNVPGVASELQRSQADHEVLVRLRNREGPILAQYLRRL